MFRLGIAVLSIVLFAECFPASKEHGLLLERLKRSPSYCGPDYPRPMWPEPPPPPPLPPPPPPVFPPPPPPQPPVFPPSPPSPPFWRGHHHHHHHDFDWPERYQEQNFRNFDNERENNPPCSSCIGNGKPTNTAISNAQSETGNAVAIAILRSKAN